MTRLKTQKITAVILIAIITIISSLILARQYSYYFANEVENENQVLVSGDVTDKYTLDKSVNTAGIYTKSLVSYSLNGFNSVDTVYNTFKIGGLKPLSTYKVELSFTLNDISSVIDALDVGFIDYEPIIYNRDGVSLSNVKKVDDESDEVFVHLKPIHGKNTYLVETKLVTNEKGIAWLIIGLQSDTTKLLDYELGEIKLKYEEEVNVN